MQIQGESEKGLIKLKIDYPRVGNLTYNFRMTLAVILQGQNATLLNKTMHVPQNRISIGPFAGGKIYKVTATSTISSQQYTKTIFVFVGSWEDEAEGQEQDFVQLVPYERPRRNVNEVSHSVKKKAKEQSAFSNSEDLMKMVGRSVGIMNQKTLDRFILKGRNCRNTKEFVGKRNSDCLKKKEMLVKGKMILRDVYKQREGMQFFKNDWFMGPFYSYDQNQKKLAQ